MGNCVSSDKKKKLNAELGKVPSVNAAGGSKQSPVKSQQSPPPSGRIPYEGSDVDSRRRRRSPSRQSSLKIIPRPSSPEGSMRSKTIQPLVEETIKVPIKNICGPNTKQCRNGHTLDKASPGQNGIYILGWSCDLCGVEHQGGGVRWHCKQCSEDYCLNCNNSSDEAIITPAYPVGLQQQSPFKYSYTYDHPLHSNSVFDSEVLHPRVGQLYQSSVAAIREGNPLENEFAPAIQPTELNPPITMSEIRGGVRSEGWVEKKIKKNNKLSNKKPDAVVPRPSGVSTIPPFVEGGFTEADIEVTIEDSTDEQTSLADSPYQQMYDPAIGKYLDVPISRRGQTPLTEITQQYPPGVLGIRHISPVRMPYRFEGLHRYTSYR